MIEVCFTLFSIIVVVVLLLCNVIFLRLHMFQTHYYQSMFTLVGGGLKTFQETHNPTSSVLPEGCDWIKQSVTEFDPENNCIKMDNRDMVYNIFIFNSIVGQCFIIYLRFSD